MSKKNVPQKNTAKTNNPSKSALPSVTAKIDRLVNYEGSNVRAVANVTLGGAYEVYGYKVYESKEKGLIVLNPATKSQKDGKYYDHIRSTSSAAHTEITNAVLKAYEQHLQEVQEHNDEGLSEGLDEDELPFEPTM